MHIVAFLYASIDCCKCYYTQEKPLNSWNSKSDQEKKIAVKYMEVKGERRQKKAKLQFISNESSNATCMQFRWIMCWNGSHN